MNCIFCRLPETVFIDSNELALAFYDKFPVSEYHTLIIPRRHVADYFELTAEEISAMHKLLIRQKERLQAEDETISGFNIGINVGINVGRDAGQTVFHVHMHLIPRRRGDMGDPKGGVRGVIPAKQKY